MLLQLRNLTSDVVKNFAYAVKTFSQGPQSFLSATQKADFVLPCDPPVLIFGVVGHSEYHS